MKYRVLITDAALADLEEICNWIGQHDSAERADDVLDRVMQAAENIAVLSLRGSRPRELPAGADADFRQVFFKPYRIVYEVDGTDRFVPLIADGRRDMQSLLTRRLLA